MKDPYLEGKEPEPKGANYLGSGAPKTQPESASELKLERPPWAVKLAAHFFFTWAQSAWLVAQGFGRGASFAVLPACHIPLAKLFYDYSIFPL